jgi:HD-GYP domain-containing protein (c-di-GMP phosphodiesterase class II)
MIPRFDRGALRGIRRRIGHVAIASLVAASLTAAAQLSGMLGSLERASVTTRFAFRHVAPPSGIVIVKIDDRTFGDLNRQWPFPRSLHARVIDRLHAAGAKSIVYDVQFTEPTTPTQDLALYRAIGAAGDVTLATSESDGHGHTNVLGGDASLAHAHARAAAANLDTSDGGTVTRFPYEVAGLESLAAVTAERANGRPIDRSRFPGGSAIIDFRGGVGTFPSVSFSAVLAGRVPARFFRNKVVIVGATAPTLQDLHPTPVSGSDLMSGPETQANAIWTALHGNPLQDAPDWLAIVAVLLAALAAPFLSLRIGVLKSALTAVAVGAGYVLGAQLAFNAGLVVRVTAPLLALALGTAAMTAASYLTANGERRHLGWIASRRTQQLRDAQLEIVTRLAQAAESRDADTGDHIERIGHLCERLALKLGLDPRGARLLRHASAMHDVGKIAIPDRILLKPGRFTEDERRVMETHAARGAEILSGSSSPLIQMAEQIALTHHERWDGSGYPNGLAGDEIPFAGRICAVCDVFDALVSKRPYKNAWPLARALEEIARGSGSHFEPALVAAFLELASEVDGLLPLAPAKVLELDSIPALGDPAGAAGEQRASAGGSVITPRRGTRVRA